MNMLMDNFEEKSKRNRYIRINMSLSLFILILTFPLLLTIAILLKIKYPKEKVLFKQKRLGLNGKIFEVYKFRTMIPNAEEELQVLLESNEILKQEYLMYRKLKNDVRIIKGVGSFLRKSSLDEFPQFFNVLLGDMSIVGPRPYMKAEFDKYPNDIVKQITSVKPGITGFWQVIPFRHETTFDNRIETDLKYIKEKSLWLDIKIIFKTVRVMIVRKGM